MTSRKIANDWHPGIIPENVQLDAGAHIETTYSFHLYRSRQPTGIVFGSNSSAYIGCMFDMGPEAQLRVGAYTLLNGLWLIADQCVSIGSHCLISWNVVIMDNFRASADAAERRRMLESFAACRKPEVFAPVAPRPVVLDDNVWVGFDCCILPGVHIGEGSVIGARSVVTADVPPYTIAAGNPARLIRTLNKEHNIVANRSS
ncbi:MAG: acyltransferase [Phycisphaerae bacterium]|nr:acyltransferase [Phycisphaerae bacterium]